MSKFQWFVGECAVTWKKKMKNKGKWEQPTSFYVENSVWKGTHREKPRAQASLLVHYFLKVCLNTSFPSSYIKGRLRVYTTSGKIQLAKAIVTCKRNILLPQCPLSSACVVLQCYVDKARLLLPLKGWDIISSLALHLVVGGCLGRVY